MAEGKIMRICHIGGSAEMNGTGKKMRWRGEQVDTSGRRGGKRLFTLITTKNKKMKHKKVGQLKFGSNSTRNRRRRNHLRLQEQLGASSFHHMQIW